jgi:hypothetical protein
MRSRRALIVLAVLILLLPCVVCSGMVLFGPTMVVGRAAGGASQVWGTMPSTATTPVPPTDAPVVRTTLVGHEAKRTHSLFASVTDDDPVYGLRLTYEVEYADGTVALMEWKSWNYGWVIGNLVIGSGNGPPGDVRILSVEGP